MTKNLETHKRAAEAFGASLAGISAGMGAHGAKKSMHMQANLRVDENWGRALCKAASEMYEFADMKDRLGYWLFSKAARAERWSQPLSEIAAVFQRAVGRVKLADYREAADERVNAPPEEKRAAKWLLPAFSKALTLSPGAVKAVLGLSAGAGALGGTAAWYLNRGVHEESADVEALKERIRAYRRVADEVEEDLNSRIAASQPEPESDDGETDDEPDVVAGLG